MEQGRVFLAIVLSLVIFVAWDFFFVDREAIQQQARSVGFHWVTLDLGGFKSGNLNRTILDHKKNEHQQNS